MSKIGYAVFGTPEEHKQNTNGLLSDLDISLYPKMGHLTLENEGETAIIIRRIPTDFKNLEKKDGVIVALCKYAKQNSDGRNGFIGSAISFKENAINSNNLSKELFLLFEGIKKNVDSNNRFVTSDNSNWNVNLPNPNENNDILINERLRYTPLSKTSINAFVKINNIKQDISGLITHFCLNPKFHSVDYLYASDQAVVLNNFKKNGLSQISYASLFNYNDAYKVFNNQLESKLKEIKSNDVKIQKSINDYKSKKQQLDNEIEKTQTKKKELEQEITKLKSQRAIGVKEVNEIQLKGQNFKKQLNQLEQDTAKQKGGNIKELKSKISSIEKDRLKKKNLLNSAISVFEKSSSKKTKKKLEAKPINDIGELIKFYDRKASKNKLLNNLLKIALILFLFIGIFYFYKHQSTLKDYNNLHAKHNGLTNQVAETKKSNEVNDLIELIDNYPIKETRTLLMHQKNVQKLLKDCNTGKYDKNQQVKSFVISKDWNYWELYYEDSLHYPLLKQVCEKFGNSISLKEKGYLVKIKNIKPGYCDFLSKNIEESYETYISLNEDIFKQIDEKYKSNKEMSISYFKLLITELNTELMMDSIGSVKVPYIK